MRFSFCDTQRVIFRKQTNQPKRCTSKSHNCFIFVDINPISFLENLTPFVWRNHHRWRAKALKGHETGDQTKIRKSVFFNSEIRVLEFRYWKIAKERRSFSIRRLFPTRKISFYLRRKNRQIYWHSSSSVQIHFNLTIFFERKHLQTAKNLSKFDDIPAT